MKTTQSLFLLFLHPCSASLNQFFSLTVITPQAAKNFNNESDLDSC